MKRAKKVQPTPHAEPMPAPSPLAVSSQNPLASLMDGRGQLTFEQRVLLIEALDAFHFDAPVLSHCLQIDEKFPDLSRQTISGYRQRVLSGEFEAYLAPLRAKRSMHLPLTDPIKRSLHLHAHYAKLINIPLESLIPILDADGNPIIDSEGLPMTKSVFNNKLSEEIRMTLEQIRKESGGPQTINVNVAGQVTHGHVHAVIDQTTQAAAQAILDQFELRDDLTAALTSSERPDMTTIESMFNEE